MPAVHLAKHTLGARIKGKDDDERLTHVPLELTRQGHTALLTTEAAATQSPASLSKVDAATPSTAANPARVLIRGFAGPSASFLPDERPASMSCTWFFVIPA